MVGVQVLLNYSVYLLVSMVPCGFVSNSTDGPRARLMTPLITISVPTDIPAQAPDTLIARFVVFHDWCFPTSKQSIPVFLFCYVSEYSNISFAAQTNAKRMVSDSVQVL